MPIISPDMMQTVINSRPVAFQALHEVCPVKHQQSGNPEALVIPLRNIQDGKKVIQAQTDRCGADVYEGSNHTEGHS